jgi:hypothetical protein
VSPDGGPVPGGSVPADGAHAGTECRACPLCQALALLRQVRPETVDQLAAAVTELVAVVRELAAGWQPGGTGVPPTAPVGEPPAGAPDAGPSGAAGSARRARVDRLVHRIDITD